MRKIEIYWLGDVEEETPKKFIGELVDTGKYIKIVTESGEQVYINPQYVACVIVRNRR